MLRHDLKPFILVLNTQHFITQNNIPITSACGGDSRGVYYQGIYNSTKDIKFKITFSVSMLAIQSKQYRVNKNHYSSMLLR